MARVLLGLLVASSALIASSPATESALSATVPVFRLCVSNVESALFGVAARENGLQQLSFNDEVDP